MTPTHHVLVDITAARLGHPAVALDVTGRLGLDEAIKLSADLRTAAVTAEQIRDEAIKHAPETFTVESFG